MIASFSRNFIFLKTRKTAGTSVECVLSAWCTDEDICTTITPVDEMERHRFGGAPRNFSTRPDLEEDMRQAIRDGDIDRIWAVRREMKDHVVHYNHMPAAEVRRALPDLWERAFKFCVERHPYEKVVSLAY